MTNGGGNPLTAKKRSCLDLKRTFYCWIHFQTKRISKCFRLSLLRKWNKC